MPRWPKPGVAYTTVCIEPGCEKPFYSKGLCVPHYNKSRRHKEGFVQRCKVLQRSRTYGISEDDYAALLELQDGKCAICGQPPSTRGLGVDHNHATGAIRGLLCIKCNVGLGHFNDDEDTVRLAMLYLRKHR